MLTVILTLQEDYWHHRSRPKGDIDVHYGTDVEGTAFAPHESDDPLGSSNWNMEVSLPFRSLAGSCLLSSL